MKLLLLSILLVCYGCDSTKTQAETTQTNASANSKTQLIQKQLMDQGYKIGLVKEVKVGECSYVIIDEETGVEFDPINFNEDAYKAFYKNGTKVYYKYFPLRMMNRCGNYQPIKLADCKAY